MEELDEVLTTNAPRMRPSLYMKKDKHNDWRTVVNGGNAGGDGLSMVDDEEIEERVAHQVIKKGEHYRGT